MSLVGLDLDSSRARAVAGSSAQARTQVGLDGNAATLPLAVSLEEKHLRAGQAGLTLARRRPHLACLDFLPFLQTGRIWSGGRHHLDADTAFSLVLDQLVGPLGRSSAIGMSVPAYLNENQLVQLHRLVAGARLRLLGSTPAPLAALLAITGNAPLTGWLAQPGFILVVDADGHALTWSLVERQPGLICLRLVQPSMQLGRTAWLRRMLDGVSHRCVRQSRRDPRESADTEQSLHEQLTAIVEAGPAATLVQMSVQGPGWYHHLMLHPDDLVAFTTPLLRQAMGELDALLAAVSPMGELAGCVVTGGAAGLPGLIDALRSRLAAAPRAHSSDDLGDVLMSDTSGAERLCVLSPEGLACGAHDLALRIHAGDVAPGHAAVVPVQAALAAGGEMDGGPARLSFRGQDHVLAGSPFILGRDPGCDIVFESELYPHVSARHCEIVYDRAAFTLYDRSRYGTLLNDRPIQQQAALHSGDWIRLGPQGPVLRFLGQSDTGR